MQPNLVIAAPESGMIYINGHFAGETGGHQPLMRPINTVGAVYIEYRPLTSRVLPMARRIVFSGGFPLAESAEEAEDVRIICWPGKITEMELMPREAVPAAPIVFEARGRNFVIDSRRRLMQGEKCLTQLPEGAEIPVLHQTDKGAALIGNCKGGMYLVTGNREMEFPNGFLLAKRIELEGNGRIRALINHEDRVGHGSLENWRLEDEGLRMVSSEAVWADGAPKWPATAEDTVCALVEAEMLGLHAEAEGYLSPALRESSLPSEIAEDYDLCVEMKYAPPESRSCTALMRLEGNVMAKVRPLYYRASASGGMQGNYRIEALELGEE